METFKYQKLIRELDEKIKFIQNSNPTRNSQDSINLIKLKMMKKNVETNFKNSTGGNLKNLFLNPT